MWRHLTQRGSGSGCLPFYSQKRFPATKRLIRWFAAVIIFLTICNFLRPFPRDDESESSAGGQSSLEEMQPYYARVASRQPLCLDGSLQKPYFQSTESDNFMENCGQFISSALFGNHSGIGDAESLLHQSRQLVLELENWLKARYFTAIRQTFAPTGSCASPKVIQYSCEGRSLCGGFGDRTRGMVSLFYLALLSNRIFHVRWLQPVDLGLYFALNADLYGAKHFQLPKPMIREDVAGLRRRQFIDSKDKDSFSSFVSNANFTNEYRLETIVSVGTNLLKIVNESGPFENQHFLPAACYYFNDFPRIDEVTQQVLFSAALRILLGKPTPKLRYEFDSFLARIVFPEERNPSKRLHQWQSMFKVGIQMRFERTDWSETPSNRVAIDQIGCFVDEAVRIIGDQKPENVFVFVTSSDNTATERVVESVKAQKPGIRAAALTMAPVVHVDRYFWLPTLENSLNMTRRDLVRGNTKVVLDWYLLTQMDSLIVSQSSFAASASLFSMAPTRVFDHVASALHPSQNQPQCLFYDRT